MKPKIHIVPIVPGRQVVSHYTETDGRKALVIQAEAIAWRFITRCLKEPDGDYIFVTEACVLAGGDQVEVHNYRGFVLPNGVFLNEEGEEWDNYDGFCEVDRTFLLEKQEERRRNDVKATLERR